jgi:thiamine biosynthesis lipoprotein
VRHNRFSAMGTSIEAWCDEGQSLNELSAWFEQVEDVCSRFRTDSELSRINQSSGTRFAPGSILGHVLSAADQARQLTDGVVDIGVGRAVRDWGYDRTFSAVTDRSEAPVNEASGEWDFSSGVLTRRGVDLDLGGIAKGWASDRAVEMGLAEVVSAGGDLRSSHPETVVSVEDPQGEVTVRVQVGTGALATSSIAKRTWHVAGRKVSHIVDPRSMQPVTTPVQIATVVADTAVEAEVGAKAVLILGVEGLAWADSQPWIRAALAFWEDGSLFATPGLEVAA